MAKIGHREGRVQVLEFEGREGVNANMSCFVHCYTSEVYGEFFFEKHLNF